MLRWVVLAAMFGGFVWSYVYFITAGKMNGFPDWPTYNTNYDMQAEGFRAGHLYLSLEPAPELVAAEDPYSPANANYWARDLSYYRAHYYLYWGPMPALLLTAVKVVLRIHSVVGDQYLCFASYVLYLLAGMVLIVRMARRLFPAAPFALSVVGILAYALANPTPYLLATPGVYQTAIVAAQAFLVTGLALAFEAIYLAARRRARASLLCGAGVAWAMAICCRASVGIPVLALALVTLVAARRAAGSASAVERPAWLARLTRFVGIADAAWVVLPIVAGSLGLLLYNKLRFHAWLDFGQRYQLNDPGLRFRASISYIWPNIYSYLLRPLVRSCHFPYAKTIWDIGGKAFPKGWVLPPGYMTAEPVAGILPTTCWAFLAPVGWWAGLRALWRARRAPAGGVDDGQQARIGVAWAALSFATLATLTAVPWIAVFATTMRYVADVSAGLLLSGMLGAWWLYDLTRGSRALRVLVVVVIVVLALITAVIGALLGYSGYIEHFHRFNPEYMDRLEANWSVCRH